MAKKLTATHICRVSKEDNSPNTNTGVDDIYSLCVFQNVTKATLKLVCKGKTKVAVKSPNHLNQGRAVIDQQYQEAKLMAYVTLTH